MRRTTALFPAISGLCFTVFFFVFRTHSLTPCSVYTWFFHRRSGILSEKIRRWLGSPEGIGLSLRQRPRLSLGAQYQAPVSGIRSLPPPPRPARLFDITSCICALGCRGSCRIRRHSRSRVCLCTCTHSPPKKKKKKKKKRHNAHPYTFSSVCVGVYGWVLFGGEEEKKKSGKESPRLEDDETLLPGLSKRKKKNFLPLPILLRFFIQTLLISALYKASQNCADNIPPITFHPL